MFFVFVNITGPLKLMKGYFGKKVCCGVRGKVKHCEEIRGGAGMAQLVSAQLSELEVPGSILGDFHVCFRFPLICVAIALNTHKTEH